MKLSLCKYLVWFVVSATFVAATGADLEAAVSEVYGTADDGTPLTWSVYTPGGTGPWPAIVVIHGGFFDAGSETDGGAVQCAQDLANAGYLAFSIAYRLAPPGSIPGQTSDGRFPDQPNDVRLAIRAARSDPRGNGRVGAVGGSSGGTHAAWFAATGIPGDDRVDVAVCLSGAYDLSDFRPDPNIQDFIDTVTNYVGVSVTDIVALRSASPAWQVAGTVAPLYLVDSVGDAMPTEQLSDMVAKLTAAGATNFQAKTLSGDGHSFDNWRAIKNEALAFVADALSVTSPTPAGLLNISTRARAATGDDVLIAGFIVGNDGGTKKLIVRAIGPSLTRLGVANALADPNLSLFDSSGKQIASNDDWRNSGQAQAVIDTGLAPSEDKESALIATLVPGAYTAVVTGVQSTQNIALVEVYDLDAANSVQLLNISTRGVVDTGDGVMIAGSIVGGTSPGTLVVRGLGPSLAERPAPIQDALPDPTLRLVDSQGTTVFSNDNWQDSQAADLIAAGLAPGDPLESGLVVTLPPGSYTSIFSDTHGATGVGLLEIYNISAGVGSPGG